jgi:uncharacterized protein DUF1580
MIDPQSTDLRPLSHLAKKIPNRRGGDGINASTPWRWALSGCRGIRLRTTMVGGIRMASEADFAEFFAAVTAAADGQAAPVRTCRQREQAIADAERELAAP